MAIFHFTDSSFALSSNVCIPEGMQDIPHIIANGGVHPLVSHMVSAKGQPNPDISTLFKALKIDALSPTCLNNHYDTASEWSGSDSDFDSDSDCGSEFSYIQEINGESFAQAGRPLSSKFMRLLSEDFGNLCVKFSGEEPEDDDMKSVFEEVEDHDMRPIFEEFEDEDMKT